ncbi:MAG: hypothetical protein R6V46_10900 [Desulfatiglandaceae bacterium]
MSEYKLDDPVVIFIVRGRLRQWAVPAKANAAMGVVSAATCIFPPRVGRSFLKNRPWKGETS